MKFTVEVEDFYLDEESELTPSLVAHIKREVVAQISDRIKGQVEIAITKSIGDAMESKLQLVIDSTIADCIATGTITVNRQPIAIIAHLKNIFETNHGWNNPGEKMAAIAKKFGEELKVQYNNIFAAKIVTTMQQQGFLKDDMARILLGDKPA